jgi:hypothetical protein
LTCPFQATPLSFSTQMPTTGDARPRHSTCLRGILRAGLSFTSLAQTTWWEVVWSWWVWLRESRLNWSGTGQLRVDCWGCGSRFNNRNDGTMVFVLTINRDLSNVTIAIPFVFRW